MTTVSNSRNRVFVGGASLVAATILFVAVFSYLAAAFAYPTVLDRPAGDVLPALLALGPTGRVVWLVYGCIPLLLLPAFLGIEEAARSTAPRLLNGFFLTSSVALSAGQPRRRWLAVVGIAASALGWVAMLRNLTPLVAPLATLNNIVLPLWMMTLGLVLVAQGRSGRL